MAESRIISRAALMNIIGPLVVLLVVTGFFAAADYEMTRRANLDRPADDAYPLSFATTESAQLVLTNISLVSVAALGMTLIIIAGGIDLSAAAAIALAATITSWAFRAGYHPVVGLSFGVTVGLITGLMNGALIGYLKVVPFIVTLGTMTIFRGLGLVIAKDSTIKSTLFSAEAEDSLPWNTWILSLMEPYPDPEWLIFSPGVWIMFLLAGGLALMLHFTVFGRHVFALGSNEDTARLCGINVTWTRIAVYTLAGLFVGIAGLYNFSAMSGVGDPTSLPGRELDIIAAVVIGGGSLNGGRGSVLGTLCGACLMEIIRHGCTVLGVPSPYQQIIIGLIVIVAVTVDQVRQRRLAS